MPKQISLQEFMIPDGMELFGISDSTIAQIYAFYKRYPQTDEYVLNTGSNSTNLASYLSLDSISVYNAYGIFLSTGRVLHKRKRLMICVNEPMLDDNAVLRQYLDESGALSFHGTVSCILEVNYRDDLEAVDVACSVIRSLLPNVIFLNVKWQFESDTEQCVVGSSSQLRSDSLQYVDVTEQVNEFRPRSVDYTTDVRKLVALREYLLSFREKANVVLAVGMLHQDVQRPFCCIAAECAVRYKMRFEIPSQYMTYYLFYMRRLHQKEFFYADEYLSVLKNPLDIGFYRIAADTCAYTCVLNNAKLYDASGARDYTKYGILYSLLYVPFDAEKRIIASNDVKSGHFGIDRIKAISLRELYQLNSCDFQTATSGTKKLGELLTEFEQILLDVSSVLGNTSLHCSNTLLFEFKGQVYLGYIADIAGMFPYTMFPMSRGYTPFEFELSIRDYENVYDIGILHDSAQVIYKLLHGGVLTGKCWHRQITGASRGMLISSIPPSTQALKQDCGLTLEEICMWESMSAAARVGRTSFVIEKIPQGVLRDKHFLTCFGGPNPMVTKQLLMDSNSWR